MQRVRATLEVPQYALAEETRATLLGRHSPIERQLIELLVREMLEKKLVRFEYSNDFVCDTVRVHAEIDVRNPDDRREPRWREPFR